MCIVFILFILIKLKLFDYIENKSLCENTLSEIKIKMKEDFLFICP